MHINNDNNNNKRSPACTPASCRCLAEAPLKPRPRAMSSPWPKSLARRGSHGAASVRSLFPHAGPKQPQVASLVHETKCNALWDACLLKDVEALRPMLALWGGSLLAEDREVINARKPNGCTALYLAAETGCAEAVEMLLQHGAQAAIPSNNGETPLFVAAFGGHLRCVAMLLEAQAEAP